MTYRKRRILFFMSVGAFLALSALLLLYTFGYRLSLSDLTLRETGGIFLHTNPTGVYAAVDAQTHTASLLTGNVFVQNLEPGLHTISVSYPGYQPWEKTIMVEPRSVVELSPLLLPLVSSPAVIPTASTTHMHVSPNATLFLLQNNEKNKDAYQTYDPALNRMLPAADVLSRTRIAGITPAAHVEWAPDQQSAVIETADDWLMLSRINTTINVRSLYKHSKLAALIPKKPVSMVRDPSHPAVYFILNGSEFSRWDTETETLQKILQSIAGFAVTPTHLILWDTQSKGPYQTTLQATNAHPYATSSLPGITSTRIREYNTHLLLFANNGLWWYPNNQAPQLLTKSYIPAQTVSTDAYVLWWDAHTLTIYWTLPQQDMPLYQTERMEALYTSSGTIKNAAPYPEESYVVLQENNTIYALELDGRGGKRNKQIIYEGTNPQFHVPPEEKIIYILDEGSVVSMELP
ncbi:MAG: PEGA domain-containing protein [Patescibacteria group bacterium]